MSSFLPTTCEHEALKLCSYLVDKKMRFTLVFGLNRNNRMARVNVEARGTSARERHVSQNVVRTPQTNRSGRVLSYRAASLPRALLWAPSRARRRSREKWTSPLPPLESAASPGEESRFRPARRHSGSSDDLTVRAAGRGAGLGARGALKPLRVFSRRAARQGCPLRLEQASRALLPKLGRVGATGGAGARLPAG